MLCDLAEYYHIYDYEAFPMMYIATLCCGLPEGSRVVKKITKMKVTSEQLLLANIADRLSLIWWSKTKDGAKNRNRPQLIIEQLTQKEEKNEGIKFDSGEDFEAMRRKIIEDKKNG